MIRTSPVSGISRAWRAAETVFSPLRCRGVRSAPRFHFRRFGFGLGLGLGRSNPTSAALSAQTDLAAVPVSLYAGVFVLVNATYVLLCGEAIDRLQS